jgi:hypothetical protein
MLSSVLRSERLDELEQRYDASFRAVFDAIRELTRVPDGPHRRLGFTTRHGA